MGSFQFAAESDIAVAPCLDVLSPDIYEYSERQGREAWSCTFAPDESCFVWSYGSPVVYIAAWHQYKQSTASVEDKKQLQQTSPRNHCSFIHCGSPVLTVAVSSTLTKPSSKRHWSKFDFNNDLMLATGLSNGRVRVWAISTGVLLHELMDHRDQVKAVAFAPDGTGRLISASADKTLKVWDMLDDGNMCKTLGTDKVMSTCAWSPNAKLLACAGEGNKIQLWDMDKYDLKSTLTGHCHHIASCEFSKDGSLLATASWDTKVILWDHVSKTIVATLGHLFPPPRPIFASGHNGNWVRGASWSCDGRHIASIADDGYLRIWDIEYPTDPVQIALVADATCCKYSPSGKVIAVGTRNGCVALHLAPLQVESLQQLCRMTIRSSTPSPKFSDLGLPCRIAKYLQYN